MLPRTLLYCTENIQVFMRVSGGGGRDPPENRRNIVFPCNAGPVKNHKVANLAFNVGPSSVCQQIQWRFAGGPDVVTPTVSPIKKDKSWTPLSKHHAPTSIEA